MMPLHVGTSGWDYPHWYPSFYSRETDDRLAFYAEHFSTVELNGTFYRLPEERTFRSWASRTPDNFTFAVKASRYLTHIRRLRQPKRPVRRLLTRVRGLGDKAGPLLLQLPPRFTPDCGRLDDVLTALSGQTVAVEFRDERWYRDDVRALLERHQAALCLADRGSRLITPVWRTADWGYIRFHEGRGRPAGAYGRTALAARARLLASMFEPDLDVWVYFNNDGNACAIRDALAFTREAERYGLLLPSRAQQAADLNGRKERSRHKREAHAPLAPVN
jgi:uncharacterized protein YecE (DUF72 family)